MSGNPRDKKTRKLARTGADTIQKRELAASELSEQELEAVAGGIGGDTGAEPSDGEDPIGTGDLSYGGRRGRPRKDPIILP